MKNTLLVFCTIIFISSCTKTPLQYAKFIEEEYMFHDDIIDKNDTSAYKVIYLETNDTIFIGTHDLLLMNDSGIFVLDNQTIKIYDLTGKHISTIDKQGKGHGEYIRIGSMVADNHKISVLDHNSQKIINYDYYGNLLSVHKLDAYRSAPYTKIGDDKYLFYMVHDGYSPQNGEVLLTDAKGNVITEFIPLKEYGDKRRSGHDTFFSKQDDGVYFIPIFEDKLYRINDELKMEEVFDLGLKSKMMSFEDVTERPIGTGTDKYTFFSYFALTDNNVFMASISKGTKPISIIVDMNKKLIRTTLNTVDCSYKNYLVTFDNIGVPTDESKGVPLFLINTEKLKFTKE